MINRRQFLGGAAALPAVSFGAETVSIAIPADAKPLEKLAANELASYLRRVYPNTAFAVAATRDASIRFERRAGAPEAFRVAATAKGAVISAADGNGMLNAVYALLEKLGCGFYLSYETAPPGEGRIDWSQWNLADAPVFGDRVVFDWHNFLSSASTWEFDDWQRYIDAARRMRFNDVMVHAYGNNPMFTFRFAGIDKPVGYLATTRSGRDWGTEHVNDVRRMVGGEVFDDAVFGASIAKTAGADRGAPARALMQRVFAHAASRGMRVTFALDVDTESANPQEMIATLPAAARIRSGKYQLANPDTPEGYAFYKAQAAKLLGDYPQITRLAVWFRNNRTPWTEIKKDEFPEAWKREFQGDDADASMFAIGKLVAAFGRALREIGRRDVELASGSWRLDFLKSADRYLPREATLLPLDWSTIFDTAAGQRALRNVRSGRKLTPIVWAHHDDRTYIGRPYTPYVNFSTLLKDVHASGFGIIHWTTRPLDMYFKGTVVQTWRATENQTLEKSCDDAALRTFGAAAREIGADYLFTWLTEAPMFGRETTDMFIDVPLTEAASHVKKSRARFAMLERIDASKLTSAGRDHLTYFREYETFIARFFETHSLLERAREAAKAGDFNKARAEIKRAQPEEAIRAYVRAARCGVMSSGEKALIVSLNLRWLPYFVSMRQAAGLEPVRVRIGKVEREPLAQGAGRNTFFFDPQGRVWRVLEPAPEAREIKLGGIMGDKLAPGRYRINDTNEVEARDGMVAVPLSSALEQIVISKSS